jgi:surface antigen
MPVALAGAANCNEAHRRHSVVHGGFRLFVPARFACLERRERAAGDRNDKPVGQSVIGSKGSSQAELDLAYARAEALSRSNRDASLPWQNPRSGAGGNITPLATSYSEAGMDCRDFLGSYMHGDAQDWLEGAACRTASGRWEVRRLKPLKSS